MDLDRLTQEQDNLNPQPSKRHLRADATRRRALSPFRIGLMVVALPLTTALIAANIYIRMSEFDRNGAILHLIALSGCEAPAKLGFGPFRKGYAGYHERYDPDRNGVSCEKSGQVRANKSPTSGTATQRAVGNAKFVRP